MRPFQTRGKENVQAAPNATKGARHEWVSWLWKIAGPVLEAGASKSLRKQMPVEMPQWQVRDRRHVTHLEACGRTLAGLAPWLDADRVDEDERVLQNRARELATTTLASIVDPESPDHLNFQADKQPLVDAAYLAQGVLRAPECLWENLPDSGKEDLLVALRETRNIQPYFNNWLLFSAMVEATLCRLGEPYDALRIESALRQFDEWYLGDGYYSDGPIFHLDYYNSYVIHPFLIDIADATRHVEQWSDWVFPKLVARAQRYGALLERMISPEGHMPVTGRSLTYRCGNLHLLGQLALRGHLPAGGPPSRYRCAMGAVIGRTLSGADVFDRNGWLRIGLTGHQPSLAESYVSTGSLYMASLAFLPLGLNPTDPFWALPDEPFSSVRLYRGEDFTNDVPLDEYV